MNLLVVADSARTWPQDVSGRYDLAPLVAQLRPDALVSLGDYSSVHAQVMAASGAAALLGVYGNHCTQDYMPEYGITDLVGNRALPARLTQIELADQPPVTVLAVQGCVRYKPDLDDVLFTQEQYAEVLDALPAADLVITHCPPAGINDGRDSAHRGIGALRRWVDRHQPRWLLHGHTYDNPPSIRHGNTEVIFVDGHAQVHL